MNIPPDLKLEIDGRHVRYPGDFIDGTLVVNVVSDIDVELYVWLQCQLHGRGNTHSAQGTPQYRLYEGRLSEGVHRFPISIEVPNGPFTYNGHYLNLTWQVCAHADVPWAIDPKVQREFVLDYEPTGMPLAHVPQHSDIVAVQDSNLTKSSGSTTTTVVAFIGIGTAGTFFCITAAIGSSGGGAEMVPAIGLFVGIAVLIAAITLRRAAGRALAERKLGKVHLELDPIQPTPGDSIRLVVGFTPQKAAKLRMASCRLRAVERVVRGSGTNRTTYTHQVYDGHFSLQDSPLQLNPGEEHEFGCVMKLPIDAPFSVDFPDNELEWSLEVRLDIEDWPDWVKKQTFNVLPSARMLPIEKENNPVAVVAADVPDEGVW